jgi:RNA polymerase-binding protein DksA
VKKVSQATSAQTETAATSASPSPARKVTGARKRASNGPVVGHQSSTVADPIEQSPNSATAAVSPATRAKADLTAHELREIRSQLEADLLEMQAEYDKSIADLNDLQQANTDGAGDDQADAGSKTFEREQEQSIAANRHDLLIQIQRAIDRIDSGTYGICENCGRPIPKARLKALPMATMDADCKAREEHRR